MSKKVEDLICGSSFRIRRSDEMYLDFDAVSEDSSDDDDEESDTSENDLDDTEVGVSEELPSRKRKAVDPIDSYMDRYRRMYSSLKSSSLKMDPNNARSPQEERHLKQCKRKLLLNYDKTQNKSHGQAVCWESKLECYFLELFPSSKFTQSIRDMMSLSEDINYSPINPLEFVSFLNYLTENKDTQLGESIYRNRGCNWKTVESLLRIVRKYHSEVGVADPTEHDIVKAKLKEIRRKYRCNGVKSMDVNLTLPLMYKVNFTMIKKLDIVKLRDWCCILLSFPIMARPSEICEYCPTIDNVKLPINANHWDTDNVPKYIQIGLHEWKHKKIDGIYWY